MKKVTEKHFNTVVRKHIHHEVQQLSSVKIENEQYLNPPDWNILTLLTVPLRVDTCVWVRLKDSMEYIFRIEVSNYSGTLTARTLTHFEEASTVTAHTSV